MTIEREAILERKLGRAKKEIHALESIIEDRSRSLFMAKEELHETVEFLTRVLETLESAVVVTDLQGGVTRVNRAGLELLGYDSLESAIGQSLSTQLNTIEEHESLALAEIVGNQVEVMLEATDGERRQALCHGAVLESEYGEAVGYVVVATNIDERKQLELDLRHAQKLESVGQLAAGVAHEINTPIQFVGDSLAFLTEAMEDYQELQNAQQAAIRAAAEQGVAQKEIGAIKEIAEEIDLEFLLDEVPGALRRAQEGVSRVATIVRAMKEFAHPGSEGRSPVDLNRVIETTLTVAKGEFKYVAELETELGVLPEVMCIVGDLNQVILNLVVNAAHSIEERLKTDSATGVIRVTTRLEAEHAVIEVQDNGTGVPEELKNKVFDPFFTTKEVGKGTGQGLALAHRIVVERHGGDLRILSPDEGGAIFRIRIPIAEESARDAA